MFGSHESHKPGFWGVALSVLVLLTCVRVWVGPTPVLPPAQAQIPDSGLQRKQLLDELKRTNQILSDILRTLENETLNVRLEGADKKTGASRSPRAPHP